ncbi:MULTISPECIES: hypothetical protein [Pseudomonadales]|uniref:hypothetical protein n=1 Tax=Pseudomonadales TaxID=72274 RepID=UPI0030033695
MVTDVDKENVAKATQCADLLSADLRAVAASKNASLAELGEEALALMMSMQKTLMQLEALASE